MQAPSAQPRASLLYCTICMLVALSGVSCSVPAEPTATPITSPVGMVEPTSEPVASSEGLKEIHGTQLYYKTIGRGAPIVFLHGGPGNSHRYFLPFMEGLSDSYQLVFYDQRGSGRSDGRLDLSAISIEQFVEDLEALRLAFGFEKISVVGHSWGAVIALFYAFKYQDRLDRLVLIAPRPVSNTFVAEMAKTRQERLQRLGAEAQQALATTCLRPASSLTEEEQKACVALEGALDFSDPARALAMDATIDASTARNAQTIRSLITTSFNRVQPDIEASLQTVRVPTLIIHGDVDLIPIASSQYVQEHIPRSQLTRIPDSGHFPFVEQPEACLQAIRAFMQT